jgi:hypothetical protein
MLESRRHCADLRFGVGGAVGEGGSADTTHALTGSPLQ